MKKRKLNTKTSLKFDWFDLLDIRIAIQESLRNAIEVDKILGVRFPYYQSDINLLKMYKRIIKSIKNYE